MPRLSVLAIAATLLLCAVSTDSAQSKRILDSSTHETRLAYKTVKLHGVHKFYSVSLEYPRFTGYSANINATLNRAIRHTINRNIPAEQGTKDYPNGFSCTYHTALITPELVSIDFEFCDYWGGARELTRHVALNYQIGATTRPLSLRAALGKPVNYRRLADLCRARLQTILPEHFDDRPFDRRMRSAFTINKRGLTFTFDEGTITACAYGCPTATFTYHELRSMISRSSILPVRRRDSIHDHCR